MADGRERQVSGHQRLAGRRQLPQKTRLDGFTLRAFLFPFGAPGDGPPCIRQRPFGIAGDRHGLPRRVRARHRLAWLQNLEIMPVRAPKNPRRQADLGGRERRRAAQRDRRCRGANP
jgi:hypothetical protein